MAEQKNLQNQNVSETNDVGKKKKGGILKFILIPVILLVQAVAAYYFVFDVLVADPNKPEKTAENKKQMKVGQFYEINDLVINPAGTKGRRFLVTEIGLETDNPKVVEEATLKDIWIRDAIISMLSKKSPDELLDYNLRGRIKTEILTKINKRLVSGKFNRLYFKKYIMQ